MNISRRSLLKGIALAPVAVALGPALKPVITGIDLAAPAADKTVATVGYLTDPDAWYIVTDRPMIAEALKPGLNAAFQAEYERLGDSELQNLFT